MLKANELRIGNLILKGDIICSVIGLRDNIVFAQGIKNENIFYREKSSDFQPIPLNEEWLLKFGFHKAERKGRYGYIYKICEIDSCWCVEKDWREDSSHFFGIEYTDTVEELMNRSFNFSYELRYIHQLQNLIFALKGEELQQAP
jgi:hypothetical protein